MDDDIKCVFLPQIGATLPQVVAVLARMRRVESGCAPRDQIKILSVSSFLRGNSPAIWSSLAPTVEQVIRPTLYRRRFCSRHNKTYLAKERQEVCSSKQKSVLCSCGHIIGHSFLARAGGGTTAHPNCSNRCRVSPVDQDLKSGQRGNRGLVLQ